MEIIKKTIDLLITKWEYEIICYLADRGFICFETTKLPENNFYFISVSPDTYDYLMLVFNYTNL